MHFCFVLVRTLIDRADNAEQYFHPALVSNRLIYLITYLCLYRWRAAHPAGVQWIDAYADRDATEVVYAFHDLAETEKLLQRLPRSKQAPQQVREVCCSEISLALFAAWWPLFTSTWCYKSNCAA